MKVYRVVIMIDNNFMNYLGDSVYSSKEKADEEIDRMIKSRNNKAKTKVMDNRTANGGRNVQIVDEDNELNVLEWFGYQALDVI